jgi:hypothetical protein
MISKLLDIAHKTEKTNKIENNIYINKKILLHRELINILNVSNGFFCFEKALKFYAVSEIKEINNIIYTSLESSIVDNSLYFAQDIFANQFCIKGEKIYLFDIESFEYEFVADSFQEWEKEILSDYNYFTGYSLAHEWQLKHILNDDERLNSKQPFILGGEYNINNLFALNTIKIIEYKLNIGIQLLDVKDGDNVNIVIENVLSDIPN